MLDRAQGTPLHHQVFLIVRDAILSGRYRPGDLLPTEEAFVAQFGVSRITIRRAMDALVHAQLIERQQGRGTFVRRDMIAAPVEIPLYSMIEQISHVGATTEAEVIEFGSELPPPDVRAAFGVAEGVRLQRTVRVRRRDGVPLMHLTTYIPEAIGATITREDLGRVSLNSLIRRAGRRIARGEQTISAELAAPIIARRLDVKIGSPLISITRMMKDAGGEPVEHLHGLFPPERYQLRFSLKPDDFAEIEKTLDAANC